MFEIEYKGGNTVLFTTKKGIIAVDPKRSIFGAKDIALNNVIEVATEARFALNSDNALISIEGPGEYEVSGFSVKGIPARRHIDTDESSKLSTMYRITIDDSSIALLGNIGSNLTEEELEEIGVVDIAIIPVGGGGYTLDATSAATLIRKIDPKVVVPVHYDDPGLRYEVPQDSVETFIKELGAAVETAPRLKVKGVASLPQILTVYQLDRG